jgi:hypothetical protein
MPHNLRERDDWLDLGVGPYGVQNLVTKEKESKPSRCDDGTLIIILMIFKNSKLNSNHFCWMKFIIDN